MTDRSVEVSDPASLLRLVQASGDLLIVFAFDGTILESSAGWNRVLGWTPAEMHGRRVTDLVHPDDRRETLAVVEGAGRGAPLLRFVNRCAMRGGGWLRLEWCAAVSLQDRLIHASVRPPAPAQAPAPSPSPSRTDDAAGDAVRAARLAEVEAISGVGSWEYDRQTGRLEWSAVTCAIHEMPAGTQLSFEAALAFYPPEARTILDPALAAIERDGTPFDLELPLVTAKGRRIWVRAAGAGTMRDGGLVRV